MQRSVHHGGGGGFRYDQMVQETGYDGRHHEKDCLGKFLEDTNLVKSYSMDITNDPRFFQDNVINYRLAAFGGLSVVSGLMVQNAMDHIFGMDKRMEPGTVAGTLQMTCFVLLVGVLFMNVLATYIGVAQPYHTIRLLTAGPTGFETATSYYLNANIVTWRHAAIKCMLTSLPVFLVASGLRVSVKFLRETKKDVDLPKETPYAAKVQGTVGLCLLTFCGILIYCIHAKHLAIFRERYAAMATPPSLTQHMQSIMTPRATQIAKMGGGVSSYFGWLDV